MLDVRGQVIRRGELIIDAAGNKYRVLAVTHAAIRIYNATTGRTHIIEQPAFMKYTTPVDDQKDRQQYYRKHAPRA